MTIRRIPEDFLVRERLSEAVRSSLAPAWSPTARHAVYELTKTSRTTPEAVQELAKSVGVRGGLASYAGLKDKHARTVQFVSVQVELGSGRGSGAEKPGAGGDDALVDKPPVAREVAGRQWSARLVGWWKEPIEAPAIDGNAFEIVVRGLAKETCSEMDRRASLLRLEGPNAGRGAALAVINYFGAQRFGSARHGKGFLALHLMRGEFEAALKLAIATPARKDAGKTRVFTRMAVSRWGDFKGLARDLPRCPERAPIEVLAQGGNFRDAFAALPYFLQAMYVEAFQSHLWNRTAHALAARISGGPERCLRSDDEYGEMLFVRAEVLASTQGARWVDMNVPVLGPETALEEPWRVAALASLETEGIPQSALKIPGLRRPFFGEAARGLVTRAGAFVMTPPTRDDLDGGGKRLKRTVSFELPRGSYATVVLRGLGQ